MSPENQIQDRYDAHDKAMNEPTYTPHIGQPYEVPPRQILHTEAKGPQELLAEMTDQRDAAITIVNQLRAERDKMLRRIGANETAQLLMQAVQKQCEETLYWKGVVRGARAELHQAGRISYEEYAALCEDTTARDHMDTLDDLRTENKRITEEWNMAINARVDFERALDIAVKKLATAIAERDAEREARKALTPAAQAYASENPTHEWNGVTQDPNGVHAALALAAKLPA